MDNLFAGGNAKNKTGKNSYRKRGRHPINAGMVSGAFLALTVYYLGWVAPEKADRLIDSVALPGAAGEFMAKFVILCGKYKDLVCMAAAFIFLPGFYMRQKARRYFFMLTLGTTLFLSVLLYVVESPLDVLAGWIRDALPEDLQTVDREAVE